MGMFVFSPSKNLIFPTQLMGSYVAAGSWPDDAIEISDDVGHEFINPAPPGKIRVVVNGLPAWVDIPPPTRDELIAFAERERRRLLSHADKITADWRTELALDEISSDDRAKLSAWMAYKRTVKAVLAVDAIATDFTWPVPPAE